MDEDTDGKDDSKRKSRNLSEKKRRDQFNMLINELSSMVSTNNRKMDKSTVLKSTISFLKSHTETSVKSRAHEIQENWKPSFLSNEEFTHLILEALDGFILVFSTTGKIFYSSDSVISLLGHKPNDLLNMSLYDMVYEDDQTELYNLLLNHNCSDIGQYDGNNIKNNNEDNQISFSCHVRRGGMDPTYELVHFVGYFRDDIDTSDSDNINSNFITGSTNEADSLVFVGTGRLDQPQLLREITVVDSIKSEFTSKHSLEWKFLFLDHRAPPIIGYLPFEVLGTSGYDYYHIDDLDKVVMCHEALMQKGEGTSCYYRFLTKGQQWIWLQTRFYITYHQWNSKPEFIVCTNKVVNYMNILKQMDSRGDFEDAQDDNDAILHDSSKSLPPVSSPWSSKSSVGKASRLALTGVSSPTPSVSVLSSGTRGRGPRMGGRHDSDSNSLSAESFTSKQSCPRSNLHFHTSHQYRSTSQKNMQELACKMPCTQAVEETKASSSQRIQQLSIDATNGLATANPVLSQPLGPQQLIDATAPQHFMTAIPVQPVIAGGFSPAAALSQAELIHPSLVMTPAQSQIQEQLQRKHEELQQLILQQQQELRLVSDQLLMARYGLLPASLLSVPVPYSVASPAGTPGVGNPALKPVQTPTSLAPPSDLFVSPHHPTLVHSPLAVAPPVVMDPQQVPNNDLVACYFRPIGVPSSSARYSVPPAGTLQTLVMGNKNLIPVTVPERSGAEANGTTVRKQAPEYYLLCGTQNSTVTPQQELLFVRTGDSLAFYSDEVTNDTQAVSDGSQSTCNNLLSDKSQPVLRRVRMDTDARTVSDQSDDTEQTRWASPINETGRKKKKQNIKVGNIDRAGASKLKQGTDQTDVYSQTKAAFSQFRSPSTENTSQKETVSPSTNDSRSSSSLFSGLSGEINCKNQSDAVVPKFSPGDRSNQRGNFGKTDTVPSVPKSKSTDGVEMVSPPKKIRSLPEEAVAQSSDLFSIPINELLQPRGEISWPTDDPFPPSANDFHGI